tara:strand:- start:74 stop:637 length:564 start_codon:yes stop_codon:yes gene_type:complete
MREDFWKEVNEARSEGQFRLWENAFPEAEILDMNVLCDVNQYLSITSGANALGFGHQTMMGPAHASPRVKPFYTEFIANLNRTGTEINWNSFLFYSLSDHSNGGFNMHGDTESVFLIQGHGDVGMVVENMNKPQDGKKIYHLKTGDALLLPPLTVHKPIPIGPRVTLSLGALPKHYEPRPSMVEHRN